MKKLTTLLRNERCEFIYFDNGQTEINLQSGGPLEKRQFYSNYLKNCFNLKLNKLLKTIYVVEVIVSILD